MSSSIRFIRNTC